MIDMREYLFNKFSIALYPCDDITGNKECEDEVWKCVEIVEALAKEKGWIVKEEYPHQVGELKTTKYFAWWPERINGKLIWLRSYEVVSRYAVRNWIAYTGLTTLAWYGGGWELVKENVL